MRIWFFDESCSVLVMIGSNFLVCTATCSERIRLSKNRENTQSHIRAPIFAKYGTVQFILFCCQVMHEQRFAVGCMRSSIK